MQLHPAPVGSDCWAIVTFLHPANAAAALRDLDRHQPALTWKALKLREWEERPAYGHGGRRPAHQAAPLPPPQQQHWQQQQQQQPSAAWADAEEPEEAGPGTAAWRSEGPGWGAVGAEHGATHEEEDWGLEQRQYEFEYEDDEEEEEEEEDYDPLVEL